MPLRYKAWHLVPLSIPLGLVLILIGTHGSHGWMVPAGIVLLSISVIDMAIVFPLVIVRANRRRRGGR